VISRDRPSSSHSSASSRCLPTKLDWATGSGSSCWLAAALRASKSASARTPRADIRVWPISHRLTVAKDTPSCLASCSWLRPRLERSRARRAAAESAASPAVARLLTPAA